jgi:hypothetical protein
MRTSKTEAMIPIDGEEKHLCEFNRGALSMDLASRFGTRATRAGRLERAWPAAAAELGTKSVELNVRQSARRQIEKTHCRS